MPINMEWVFYAKKFTKTEVKYYSKLSPTYFSKTNAFMFTEKRRPLPLNLFFNMHFNIILPSKSYFE